MDCRVELFGHLKLTVHGVPVAIKSQRESLLLALLALEFPSSLPRSFLADTLWPETSPQAGRNSLSVALHGLRKIISAESGSSEFFNADAIRVGLNPQVVSTDVQDFRLALKSGKFGEAVKIYRPNLAFGLVHESLEHAESLLQLDAIRAHEDHVRQLNDDKEYRQAHSVNANLLQLDPFNERAHVRSIKLLLKLGNRPDALAAYESFARMLKTNFGTEPRPAVKELVADIRPAKMRNFVEPDLATGGGGRTRNPLPIRLTKYFGRSKELALLQELLGGDRRLVTVVGLGGIGKTRFAEEGLRAVMAGPDSPRVFFASLAAHETLDSATAEVARVANQEGVFKSLRDLAPFLSTEPTILVLDSVEHLIRANGPDLCDQVEELIDASSQLTILCTSRVLLELEGEAVLRLESLAEPPKSGALEEMIANPRIQLYVDRARLASPEFVVTESNIGAIAEVSRFLEGIPLAIELAAANVRAMPPKALLTRLESRLSLPASTLRKIPSRHRSLRAMLETSFEVLKPVEQRALSLCAVFRGGCFEPQLSALVEAKVGSALGRLCDVSLLNSVATPFGQHYKMFEVVREFASDTLAENAETEELRDRHAMIFLAVAQECQPMLADHQQAKTFARMQLDRENFFAALDCLLSREDRLDEAIRMVTALWRYWSLAGILHLGRTRMRTLLKLCEQHVVPPELLAEANKVAGSLAYSEGDFETSRMHHEKAIEFFSAGHNPQGLAASLNNAALSAMRCEEIELAIKYATDSHRVAKENNIPDVVATAVGTLGLTQKVAGQLEPATQNFAEAVAQFQELGNTYATANNLRHLATCEFEISRDTWRARLAEAIKVAESLESEALLLSILVSAALLFAKSGNPESASTLFATVQQVRNEDAVSLVAGDATLNAEASKHIDLGAPLVLAEAIELTRNLLSMAIVTGHIDRPVPPQERLPGVVNPNGTNGTQNKSVN